MRRRKWRKELEYPEPRNAIGFYSKNLCASLMVPPFERLIRNFNRLKWKWMKKDEFWALWGVIWIRNEWVMAKRRIGNEGFRESNGGFWFMISKSEFIGAGTRCNWLQHLVIVATYPSAGGWCGARGCIFQDRKMRGVATNVYSRKTSEKPKKT